MCPTCLRALSACICHWIAPTANALEVLILQHPLEATQAKGSARLLCLSVRNCRMLSGEVFEAAELQALLTDGGKQPVLLYPDAPVQSGPAPLTPLAPPAPLALCASTPAADFRLVVIDATWRKSRKMLHLNPLLNSLPRVALQGQPASKYRIRKAHQPHQLSTLEATCAALIQLQGSAVSFGPLLAAFEGFVDQQASRRQPLSSA
jgi:DTW domain-containing protein YfiP